MSNQIVKTNVVFKFQDKEYEARVRAVVMEDMNYGADADGNRGTYASWIEEVEVLGTVYCHTDKQEIEEVSEDMYEAICVGLEKMDLEGEISLESEVGKC